jgi:hypothetical protein
MSAREIPCATLPKAAICVLACYSALSETCRALICGFLTCSPHLKRRQKRVLHLCGEQAACSKLQDRTLAPPPYRRREVTLHLSGER